MKAKLLLTIFIAPFVLQACGQTGPLYLPDEKPPIYVPPEEEENQ